MYDIYNVYNYKYWIWIFGSQLRAKWKIIDKNILYQGVAISDKVKGQLGFLKSIHQRYTMMFTGDMQNPSSSFHYPKTW